MMNKKKNLLVWRNGRWFENGKWLPKRDYTYHSSGNSGDAIISGRTGQLYHINNKEHIFRGCC